MKSTYYTPQWANMNKKNADILFRKVLIEELK